ncbi:uncharacterized protein LOC119069732 [Bradysia coprophila]|uniref:uncharacterized protein LOC119069732 n=1 Tax=Bradysia coprophila TaxID=38358 RepID=UPI00187D719C|nr:uncharacterized protein LOC119069732 [Bradysia coprophila]
MIFIKILVLIVTYYANAVSGIQVYENVTNDITTETTKLALVPTTIAKIEAVGKDNVTESSLESMKPNDDTITNNSTVDLSQEKNARKNENGRATTGKIEQHEKTSSNVKHEKFVPSPEISLSGIEIRRPSGESKTNDNFYPLSHYYQPVKHSLHFHSSAPITSNSNWKYSSSNLDSLQKNYPKFEDEIQQQRQKEIEKFTFPPPSIDSSKWYLMPDRPSIESTDKPSGRPSGGGGKWKWVSDDEEEQDKRSALSQPNFPTIPPNEFSYTYEIPTTDSTPFSVNKYEGVDQPLNGEIASTALGVSESEWESPFTSSNGKLKHKGKGKGKSISPWKKILHVLTAAIPIGLLISALTPQVIYVDPNATSSISPTVHSLNLLTTTKQRSLDEGVHVSNGNDLTNGRKFVSNPLMDFLHVLRDNGNSMERSDSCDDRKFCEASRSGSDADASVLNKMLWKIANETPEFQARKSGLEHIFHAIRHNNCSIFECKQPDLNKHRPSNRKN